jgi:hypothetical protein
MNNKIRENEQEKINIYSCNICKNLFETKNKINQLNNTHILLKINKRINMDDGKKLSSDALFFNDVNYII